jgi:DtxR family Mn-dependent transcriptional regulator
MLWDALGAWTWLVVGLGVAALFIPRFGPLAALRRRRRRSHRILVDDALKHIHNCLAESRAPSVESVAGALHVALDRASRILADMERHHLVCQGADGLDLTAIGRTRALHIIRAHRLWEHHLAEETGFGETEWHRRAERREHRISPEEADALAARLGHPTHDPHGDPIPTRSGRLVDHGGRPLTSVAAHAAYRIVHVEDEPQSVYDRLIGGGICPGLAIEVREVTAAGYRVRIEGEDQVLPALVASNVYVVASEDARMEAADETVRLGSLRPGESGRVVRLSSRCRGPERRRLMDLGILPGAVIGVEMASPSGDPIAYAVRDALIALRLQQADLIHVVPCTETAT